MPIHWPDRYAPGTTAVHVSNEITIDAPPQAVWGVLLRAVDWPGWYPNSRDVRLDGGGAELALGSRFTWKTFGVPVSSTVREFVAPERIAWDGSGPLMDVYHAWLIEPRGAGSWVLTRGKPERPRRPRPGPARAQPHAQGASAVAGAAEGDGGGALGAAVREAPADGHDSARAPARAGGASPDWNGRPGLPCRRALQGEVCAARLAEAAEREQPAQADHAG